MRIKRSIYARATAMVLAFVLTLLGFIGEESISKALPYGEPVEVYDESNTFAWMENYTNLSTGYTYTGEVAGARMVMNGQTVFCLQPSSPTHLVEYPSQGYINDVNAYIEEIRANSTLLAKLDYAAHFGYNINPNPTIASYMFTQRLIWDILKDHYGSNLLTSRGERVNSFNFVSSSIERQYQTWKKNLMKKIDQMFVDVSFNNKLVHIIPGQSIDITDEYSVLSTMSVSPTSQNGLKLSISGNQLSISADPTSPKSQVSEFTLRRNTFTSDRNYGSNIYYVGGYDKNSLQAIARLGYVKPNSNTFSVIVDADVTVKKSSSNETISEKNNKNYSYEGAEFGIFYTQKDALANTNMVTKIVTDSSGSTKKTYLSPKTATNDGVYYVKELKAPLGFKKSSEILSIDIAQGDVVLDFKNEPKSDPLGIMLRKEGDNSIKLKDAEFEVKFYPSFLAPEELEKTQANRTWIFKTGSLGFFTFDEYSDQDGGRISGDALYLNKDGIPTGPIGTYSFREIKAPQGYRIDPKVYYASVKDDGNFVEVVENGTIYNSPTVVNKSQLMRFKLKKEDFLTGIAQGQNSSLENASYDIIRVSDNKFIKTITTGPDGLALSGDLAIDTYDIVEKSPSSGYDINPVAVRVEGKADGTSNEYTSKVRQISSNNKALIDIYNSKIDELNLLKKEANLQVNGQKVSESLEEFETVDNPIIITKEMPEYGRIKLRKIGDQFSGNLPEAGVDFQVKDFSGKVVETITTNKDGIALSNWLVRGEYTISQINHVDGMIDIDPFKVNVEGDWTEHCFELINRTDLKQLQIVKIDAETKKEILQAGVIFELYDQDSNKIVQKLDGVEVSEFVSDESGKVILPEGLKSGSYYIKELKAPSGYYLDPNGEKISLEIPDDNGLIKVVVMQVENTPQKGRLILEKTASKLSGVSEAPNTGLMNLEFSDGYLAGSKWELRAKEDIYSSDKTTLIHKKDELIKELVTSDKGPVVVENLANPGLYTLKEVASPKEYVLDPRTYDIVFSPQAQEISVESETIRAFNDRKNIDFNFTKNFEYTDLFSYEPQATFGLYLAKDYLENGINIKAGSLLDTVTVKATIDDLVDPNEAGKTKSLQVKGSFENVPIDGSFYLKELSTDQNYILDSDSHPLTFDFSSSDIQNNTSPALIISNELQKINLTVVKTELGSLDNSPVSGAVYKLVAVDSIKGEISLGEFITDQKGQIKLDLLPKGNYYLEEVKAPEGYFRNEDKYSLDLSKSSHDDLVNIDLTNEKVPAIKTQASDESTNKKEHNPTDIVKIKDQVIYKDLIINKEYEVRGILMDKSTNKPFLDENNKEITETLKFTPQSRDGSVFLTFEVKGDLLRGKTTVVFEELYKDGKLLTVHKDINDIGQTTRTIEPEIMTSFADIHENKSFEAKGHIELIDKVTYKDLIVGDEYELKLVLMDKSTSKPLIGEDGKILTVTKKFIAKSKEGIEEVKIQVNLEDFAGKNIVAFEELYFMGELIADHKDITDKNQTISVNDIIVEKVSNPKTGDTFKIEYSLIYITVCILALRIIKKRNEALDM